MRLWHYKLLPYLDQKRLLGQHRECCALRGLSWGKKHSTVDYVFKYSYKSLFSYHLLVIKNMLIKNINVNLDWLNICYRGKKIGKVDILDLPNYYCKGFMRGNYKEHNSMYLLECLCLLLLKNKFYYFSALDHLEKDDVL